MLNAIFIAVIHCILTPPFECTLTDNAEDRKRAIIEWCETYTHRQYWSNEECGCGNSMVPYTNVCMLHVCTSGQMLIYERFFIFAYRVLHTVYGVKLHIGLPNREKKKENLVADFFPHSLAILTELLDQPNLFSNLVLSNFLL